MGENSITTTAFITVTDAGIAVFGIAIGLRPELMLAGLWGAFWALSYAAPSPLSRRCSLAIIASIIAGYATPAAITIAEFTLLKQAPDTLLLRIQFPIAVLFGFLAHRFLGPFLMRFAKKKSDEVAS